MVAYIDDFQLMMIIVDRRAAVAAAAAPAELDARRRRHRRARLERFAIKLHRADPLPLPERAAWRAAGLPHQGGGPLSALLLVLPPPRWGRVGVGVMRRRTRQLGPKPP